MNISGIEVPEVNATSLGDEEFKKDYKLPYAYVTGGMYHGIASKKMVSKICQAGMMGYFGTGGLKLDIIEEAIDYFQKELDPYGSWGMNLLNSQIEGETIDLYLRKGVKNIEAAAYIQITPALILFRLKGVREDAAGNVVSPRRIMAKVSRPEVAKQFLSPPSAAIVDNLLESKKITHKEAALACRIPIADDICAEADSGGHTDQAVAYALLPAMIKLRDNLMKKYNYCKRIRVGAAGGIGTPSAAAAAFFLGADFILTGSINQCTVEAKTSEAVKDLLQQIDVQDTDYAPAGDMFEIGAKVQVLRKGVFFPARANKLHALYQKYNSLDEIDEDTKNQLEKNYFKRSLETVYAECRAFYPPLEIEKAENNPKYKMLMVFKWYFGYSTRLALQGDKEQKINYQVHTGPALGAFNQWVKGTQLENWRNRHVDVIGKKIMHDTADLINTRYQCLCEKRPSYE